VKVRRKILLRTALREESPLRQYVAVGLGALAPGDVKLIHEGERPKIGDSLDLDAASRQELPQEHRWDYLVSSPATAEIVGVEPHTARDEEIRVVIAKKAQARSYLRSHLREGLHVARWVWVTRGKVNFTRMERARRLLDQNGIEFAGRILRRVGRGSE